jgi:hydrogenase maturation protease
VSGKRILVLGYGNPGRQDDGLGPEAADRIEAMGLPDVAVDSDYQLNIEDAATMAGYDMVLFVDASVDAAEPFTLKEIRPASAITFTSHSVSPESVLAICDEHLGAPPKAWVLAIRGYAFEFDGQMTDRAKDNLEKALETIPSLFRAWKEQVYG